MLVLKIFKNCNY